ncbi:MAG: hypothetical protein AB1792_00815 [Candidatus Zixiibacteriota bacterium]
MRHPGEDELILCHYGEGDAVEETRAHLQECMTCREAYARLERILAAVDLAPVPERSADYTERMWARLRPQLIERRSPRDAVMFPMRRWAWAAAVAATVILAFMAGRFWQQHEKPTPGSADSGVRERILLVAVGEHLERSQMMLVELTNTHPRDTVDLEHEQTRARELLADNRIYRQAALRDGDRPVAAFLEELERVLVDIANRPTPLTTDEYESFRQGIERNGILFKVRVLGADMRQRERFPAADSLHRVI